MRSKGSRPKRTAHLKFSQAFLAFLSKRKGLLDGVCVTGGEPTLCPELPELLRGIKDLGFAVKLDTNGSRPDVLKALVDAGLVDYVAMDVKNSPARYAETVGLPRYDLGKVEESLRFLIQGKVEYELRTTVVSQLHDDASMTEMGQWLQGLAGQKPRALFLQKFVDRESVIFAGLLPPDSQALQRYAELLGQYVEKISVRGE